MIPKMRGGGLKIVMGNIHGLPNSKNNQHKIKAVGDLLEDKGGAVLVEAANTKQQVTWTCCDNMEIRKEIKVENKGTRQVISGKGTVVMMSQDIQSQQTRQAFNNEKTITHMINVTDEVNNNLVVGAHQAPNEKNMHKWLELEVLLEGLDLEYSYPKIVYVDTNTEVTSRIFERLEEKLGRKNWQVHKCKIWTRKGYGLQKNSNIDVILTKNVDMGRVRIKWLPYQERLSDHRLIQVELLDQNIRSGERLVRLVRAKKHERWASIRLLEDLLASQNLAEVLTSFERRQKEGRKFNKLKPNFYNKIIRQLEDRQTNWTAQDVRKAMIQNYQEVFWKEVGSKDMNHEAKEWHKSMKKLTRYVGGS